MAQRTITIIPATFDPTTRMPATSTKKRRVAAYARVSTDSEEQLTSYEAQQDYYSKFIKSNPEWQFVDIYTDDISGLSTRRRKGFNEMISDALNGKIDYIITKSVSRFARNTVDTLTTIHKLKDKNVEVYFEKENISTFDGKGEVFLTIMSSLAQEESRSISENVTWGQRKRFADGKLSLAYKSFLGYDKGPDKDHPLVVNKEQAEIVKRIYRMFIEGKTPYTIARTLTAEGIPTPGGKEKWGCAVIESILTNEKYRGSALLQKSFTVNFLEKKMKTNEGEVPQYYIEHSHEAIIPPEDWELVQIEMARRKALKGKYSGNSVFSARLVCEDCGGFYGSKTWNSTDKYRRVIWQCNNKFKGEHQCHTPHITEEEIKERFLEVYNSFFANKDNILSDCEDIIHLLTDCIQIDAEIEKLQSEIEDITELTRKCIQGNASSAITPDEFKRKYDRYDKKYNEANEALTDLVKKREERCKKAQEIRAFMARLQSADKPITEFDHTLWVSSIDKVIVRRNGKLVFCFRNGNKIEN